MNFYEYQSQAISTAIYPDNHKILYPALGLANETGELLGKIKKMIRDENLDRETIQKHLLEITQEAGDVLWYLAVLCHDLGISLDQTAVANIDKLQDRQQRGVLGGSGDSR